MTAALWSEHLTGIVRSAANNGTTANTEIMAQSWPPMAVPWPRYTYNAMKTVKIMKKRSFHKPRITALATLLVATSSAFANLIPIDVVPTTGNGLGAVSSIVTFQNTGTEVGAIGLAPGGAVTLGSTVAYGIDNGFPSPAGVTHETTGSGNNVYTTTQLGITATGPNTFSNLVLLFNGNEGGNTATESITLTNLSLNLFSPTGAFLDSFSTVAPFTVTSFTGVGNAGFGFQLDAIQAGQANALFLANPIMTIGVAARATGANGGFESISISRLNSGPGGGVAVPDGGMTVMMLGGALIGITLLRRRTGNKV